MHHLRTKDMPRHRRAQLQPAADLMTAHDHDGRLLVVSSNPILKHGTTSYSPSSSLVKQRNTAHHVTRHDGASPPRHESAPPSGVLALLRHTFLDGDDDNAYADAATTVHYRCYLSTIIVDSTLLFQPVII